MKLAPRYDGPPVIDVDGVVTDPTVALVRQRERLAGSLAALSPEQWAAPSRCEGWSVQDVAAHLVSVNRFWVLSIGAGLRGEPSRLLESFDPVAVPAAIVASARGAAPASTLEELTASNGELAALVGSVVDADWALSAEAPPGHLGLRAVCAHALWDAWVHERDVLLPLGQDPPTEPDEVAIALSYAAALGPAFYLNAGTGRRGSLTVRASGPEVTFTVEVTQQVTVRPGAPDAAGAAGATLAGDAVGLLERLSCRGPEPAVAEDDRWLVDGLRRAFDSPA